MTTIIIGNFDGVHLGHQALIRVARENEPSDELVAVTFDAHPATLTRSQAPARLTTNSERARLLLTYGVSRVLSLPITAALLNLEPEAFIEFLREQLPFTTVVEGADFRFGRDRMGDVQSLRRIGERASFQTIVAPDIDVALHDGQLVSARSSMVRWLLLHGRVADAKRILGRAHAVVGVVTHGARRGRELGFPTANLGSVDVALPMDGIYAVDVEDAQSRRWRGAASLGTNPTFGSDTRRLEVHMLHMDPQTDLYGQSLTVAFDGWLRDMIRFESIDVLVQQIGRDCARVMA